MKFGREYETALANEGFPQAWVDSAIQYKYLKKCIKKIHRELETLGLDKETLHRLNYLVDEQDEAPAPSQHDATKGFFSAAEPSLSTIVEEFTPRLQVLVDNKTGLPLDATLTPETRASLQRLAKHELMVAGRREHLGEAVHVPSSSSSSAQRNASVNSEFSFLDGDHSDAATTTTSHEGRWIQVPLASAQNFFDLLEPKLEELEALGEAERRNLEMEILDVGDAVEDVIEPVREGFEATRSVSYRDLYFWREMFRLYLEKPIFYSETERRRGALTFAEARHNLEEYDRTLRSTGLLAKMKTANAQAAAKQFLDLNVHILKIMHFQEMNGRAMAKILKKFNKQTHLQDKGFTKSLQLKFPALLTNGKSGASGFANSIARDLHAEVASKVLAIVPQLDDWNCPVCYSMAWRPVNLGCCRSVFCIRCIIKLQDEGMKRCPMCNSESVMGADGRNINFEAMDFLEKYFPMEVRKRQKENEREQLIRDYGEEFVKPACSTM